MVMTTTSASYAAVWMKRMTPLSLVTALILTSGCTFPRKDHSGVPDVSVIRVVQGPDGRLVTQAPDCETLQQGSQYQQLHEDRPTIAFGCATYSNLAASVARPADLVSPRSFAGPQPDAAALAVHRYRINKVEPLRQTQSTDVGN